MVPCQRLYRAALAAALCAPVLSSAALWAGPREAGNARAGAAAAAAQPGAAWRDEDAAGQKAFREGRLSDAETLWKAALRDGAAASATDQVDSPIVLAELGELYVRQSKFAEARKCYQAVIDVTGTDLPLMLKYATLSCGYGNCLVGLGNDREAALWYAKAWDICARGEGADHPRAGTFGYFAARSYARAGRGDDAKKMMDASLPALRRAYAAEPLKMAIVLNDLAYAHFTGGARDTADSLCREALALEKKLDPEGEGLADSATTLGLVRLADGKYAEAEQLLRQARAIRLKRNGPSDRVLVPLDYQLAAACMRRQNVAGAEALLKEGISLAERLLGPQEPMVGQGLVSLAMLNQAEGRLEAAGALYKKGIPIVLRAQSPDAPQVAPALSLYEGLLRQTGHADQADRVYSRARTLRAKYEREDATARAE